MYPVTSDCTTFVQYVLEVENYEPQGKFHLTFTKLYRVFTTLEMMALQGIFGKVGNNGNRYFLLIPPQCFTALAGNFNSFVFLFRLLCKNIELEGVYDLICIVFNAVFHNFSCYIEAAVHLSMLSWDSFNQYSAQYSSHPSPARVAQW